MITTFRPGSSRHAGLAPRQAASACFPERRSTFAPSRRWGAPGPGPFTLIMTHSVDARWKTGPMAEVASLPVGATARARVRDAVFAAGAAGALVLLLSVVATQDKALRAHSP